MIYHNPDDDQNTDPQILRGYGERYQSLEEIRIDIRIRSARSIGIEPQKSNQKMVHPYIPDLFDREYSQDQIDKDFAQIRGEDPRQSKAEIVPQKDQQIDLITVLQTLAKFLQQ